MARVYLYRLLAGTEAPTFGVSTWHPEPDLTRLAGLATLTGAHRHRLGIIPAPPEPCGVQINFCNGHSNAYPNVGPMMRVPSKSIT